MLAVRLNLFQVNRMNEEEARQYVESVLWPGGPICPHCGSEKAWDIKGARTRSGVYECAECGKQFTVTVGTVMHGSHIPLRQWLIAFHLMTSSKKGVSALQLQRNLGLGSYRSAWHLAHRIRLSMNEEPVLRLLKGTVEVDETYVGGQPKKTGKSGSENPEPKKKNKRSRGTHKVPALALLERNRNVISMPIERVHPKTFKGAIKEACHKDSCIMTDEWASYAGISKDFEGRQEVVNHNDGEFVRGKSSTNTVESYFGLLKRGVHGIFDHVSKHHSHRYCDEFSSRWNLRKITHGERIVAVLKGPGGKRFEYKTFRMEFCLSQN